jgi:hypothetical protein
MIRELEELSRSVAGAEYFRCLGMRVLHHDVRRNCGCWNPRSFASLVLSSEQDKVQMKRATLRGGTEGYAEKQRPTFIHQTLKFQEHSKDFKISQQ